MATKVCLGGDISQNASWSPVATVPTSGDDIFFNASTTSAITAGFTAMAAVDPASVTVTPDCPVALGDGSSNWVQFNDITALYLNNSLATYIQCDTVTNARQAGSTAAIGLKGLTALAIANYEVAGGSNTLTFTDGTVTYLVLANCPDQTVVLGSSMTAATTVESESGTLTIQKAPVTLHLYKNAVANIVAGTTGTITTYRGSDTSTLNHKGTTTITTARLFDGGVIDFRANYETGTPTITNAYLYGANSVVYKSNSTGNVAVTNEYLIGGSTK